MPNNVYDKPFKTYEEQIEILRSRNITITDTDFAKKALSSISYYTLINGYKQSFLSIEGTEKFIEGTDFKILYTLHVLDTSLNNIILKYILYVERSLKTRISYRVSSIYGVYTDYRDLSNNNRNDYLFRDNYSGSRADRNNILRQIKEIINSNRISPSVEHYITTKNHLPAWILVTSLPFGLMLKWYSILSSADKTYICSEFIADPSLNEEQKKEFLSVSLSLLKEYRNKIAHGNRTFCVPYLPVLPKKQIITLSKGALSVSEYNSGFGKSDLYSVILTCFILLNDQYLLTNFYSDLKTLLLPYSSVPFNGKSIYEVFQLPSDILDRLIKIIENRFYTKPETD